MQIVVDNIEQFKSFFDVVYDMSSELLELQLFPERMVCAVLDRGRTRFFHVEYRADFFDVYDVDDATSVIVFVDDLYKLLKMANKTDILHLEIDDPRMIAKLESNSGNSRIFEFVLSSDFTDSPTYPQLDFPVVLEVDVGDLNQSAKDIKVIGSNQYKFVINKDSLTVMTDDTLSTKYAHTIDVDVDVDNVVSATFTLEYVMQMLKFNKISNTVTIKIGDDYPLFYTFADDLMGVRVNGMIAPRISEDEV